MTVVITPSAEDVKVNKTKQEGSTNSQKTE